MELWTRKGKATSCIIWGSCWGMCCSFWLLLWTPCLHFCRTPVSISAVWATSYFLCKTAPAILIASLFFFHFLWSFAQNALPHYVHCTHSKCTFIFVLMNICENDKCFSKSVPICTWFFCACRAYGGRKENSWSLLAVNLLGTEFVKK